MDLRDIHVCISAYACDPTRGSEPGIGWNLVREVARRHRVWAITRRKNQAAISAELQRAPLPKLRMIYFDLPEAAARVEEGPVGIDVYYRLWQRLTRRLVEDLHRDVRTGSDAACHLWAVLDADLSRLHFDAFCLGTCRWRRNSPGSIPA